jgi:hypothetical protein
MLNDYLHFNHLKHECAAFSNKNIGGELVKWILSLKGALHAQALNVGFNAVCLLCEPVKSLNTNYYFH